MFEPKKFQEQAFFTTVMIAIEGDGGGETSIGTGFIVGAKLPDDSNVLLLVSNAHVIAKTKDMKIVFHGKQSGDFQPDLYRRQVLFSGDFKDNYYPHPDPEVDLACVNISSVLINHPVYFKALILDNFATFEEEELVPGKEVWFVGYPNGFYDCRNNLPIMRHGYIASIPRTDFEGQQQFVIDGHVYQGSSGSPVFGKFESQVKLLGVLTETIFKSEPLRSYDHSVMPHHVRNNIGLGMVLKAGLVKQLIAFTVLKISDEAKQGQIDLIPDYDPSA